MRKVSAVALACARTTGVNADAHVPHWLLFQSPAEYLHSDTTPVVKTWLSSDFLNPLPRPCLLRGNVGQRVQSDPKWLELKLMWVASDSYSDQFAEFQVWRSQDEGAFSLRGFAGSKHSFVDDHAVYNTKYQYKVRIVTELGMGPFSTIFATTTPPPPADYKPPSSDTSPSARLAALKEKIRQAEELERQLARAFARAVEDQDMEEDLEDFATGITPPKATDGSVRAPSGNRMPSNPAEASRPNTNNATIPADPTAMGEHDLNHVYRLAAKSWQQKNETGDQEPACTQAEKDRGLCEEVSGLWYFDSILDKLLGDTSI